MGVSLIEVIDSDDIGRRNHRHEDKKSSGGREYGNSSRVGFDSALPLHGY